MQYIVISLTGVRDEKKFYLSKRTNKSLLLRIVVLIILFAGGRITAQEGYSIEGTVIDLTANEPIPFASVYLSGTTFGAITDEKGFYKISKLPTAQFDLVASNVGYNSQIVKIDFKNTHKKIVNFKLERIMLEFQQVEVSGEKPAEWFDQLELFKKLIFGQNDFAKECTIKNPYYINFIEDDGRLIAETTTPIKIRNNALGYELECVLKYFEYSKNSGALAYSLFPKFVEIIPSSRDSSDNFIYNRKSAFFGSSSHLLSSLAAGTYKFRDEGFELRKNALVINKASEIVYCDSVAEKYYLRYDGCLRIQYWNRGKRSFSTMCLNYGSTQFSPAGYLMFPGEFNMNGDMAKEGVATMLPRFLEIKDNDK